MFQTYEIIKVYYIIINCSIIIKKGSAESTADENYFRLHILRLLQNMLLSTVLSHLKRK